MVSADWASIKFLVDGEEHTTMRLSKADPSRDSTSLVSCFRKPVNCPKVSSGSKRVARSAQQSIMATGSTRLHLASGGRTRCSRLTSRRWCRRAPRIRSAVDGRRDGAIGQSLTAGNTRRRATLHSVTHMKASESPTRVLPDDDRGLPLGQFARNVWCRSSLREVAGRYIFFPRGGVCVGSDAMIACQVLPARLSASILCSCLV